MGLDLIGRCGAAAPHKRDPAGSQGLMKGSARSKCIDGVPAGPKFNCCAAKESFSAGGEVDSEPQKTRVTGLATWTTELVSRGIRRSYARLPSII